MALSATATTYSYPGPTGTVFPFPYPVSASAHLQVYKTDLTTGLTSGAALVLGTDYTLTGVGGNSCTVTLTADLGQYGLFLKRVVPLTQTVVLDNSTTFSPKVHENEFDKLTQIDQQQEETIGRSIHTGLGDTADTELPALIPNYAVVVNPAGDGFDLVPNSEADLLADLASTTSEIMGAGRIGHSNALPYAAGTVGKALVDRPLYSDLLETSDPTTGAGMVGFSSATSYDPNTVGDYLNDLASGSGAGLVGFLQSGTGAVARTVQDKLRDQISVDDFGTVGDGVADDSAALALASTAAAGKTLVFTRVYRVSSDLTFGATVDLLFMKGATLSIDAGKTVTANGSVVSLSGTPYTGAGTMTFAYEVNMFMNQYGFAIGRAPSANTDDFIHFQRDVNTSSGILVINDDTGAAAEGFIHLWGGPRSGGSQGSGIRMSANSLAGGALVDIVAHHNSVFSIIQASDAPLDFYAGNKKILSIASGVNVVNSLKIIGGAAGSAVQFDIDGTDTNVSVIYNTKGTGSHFFRTGAAYQMEIKNTPGATNRVVITGSNAGNPSVDTSGGALKLGGTASDIQWGKALVALGGGAAPTLGTIGGTGPASAAQNSWMRVLDSAGVAFWVPAWK